jgi:hypothetical protein
MQIGVIEKFSSQIRIYITSGGTPPGKARVKFCWGVIAQLRDHYRQPEFNCPQLSASSPSGQEWIFPPA